MRLAPPKTSMLNPSCQFAPSGEAGLAKFPNWNLQAASLKLGQATFQKHSRPHPNRAPTLASPNQKDPMHTSE